MGRVNIIKILIGVLGFLLGWVLYLAFKPLLIIVVVGLIIWKLQPVTDLFGKVLKQYKGD